MGSIKDHIDPATQLGSAESRFWLNQIDRIRANGVGSQVSLPQLAVCGDQSTGKSSVLERLTGIPFPRQDGLCTRFPTEIILRHEDGPREIVATICPDTSRESKSQEILRSYRKIIPDFTELPTVIEEVSALMGLRPAFADSSAFCLDALRIEVSGPTGLHLTIVDLPGLISVSNEEQSDEDVEVVHRLVDNYLKSSRTIILAVVQAGNDIANQTIVQKAKRFDPDGIRTVGIITKPDLINGGTEHQIARLANNEGNVKLKLGFFILKNPSPKELEAGHDAHTLERIERDFFAQSNWRQHDINEERIGSSNLKLFLQALLLEHIERELPKVREELKKNLLDLERKQKELGNPRPTLNAIRSFLIERSMCIHQLAQDSLQGHYLGDESDFFRKETRLRALVHQMNSAFARQMRVEGSKRAVVNSRASSPAGDSACGSFDDRQTEQLQVTQKEMLEWVKAVYQKTRGLELPGNYNHNLLTELFQTQASRWPGIAVNHVKGVVEVVRGWLRQALTTTVQDEDLRRELLSLCHDKLDETATNAFQELVKLWADELRQPITYNHYFTDNIQKARHNIQRETVQTALETAIDEDWNGKMHISNHPDDIARLTNALQRRVLVNMDDRACNEALEGMEAYYKVSLKTFVDNVCRQVVERHILAPLPTFFSPTTVSELSDCEILRIGSEPEKKQAMREKLISSANCLRLSLKELSANPHE